jgi:hypothetical protein
MRLKVIAAIAMVITLPFAASPAWPGPQVPATDGLVTAPESDGVTAAHHPGHTIKAALQRISPSRLLADRLFKRAEVAFPAFCKDWESKLRARERNNVSHINWQAHDGVETGTYVGYGSIQSCITKESSKGIPVGKLSYQEFQYQLEGKTTDEAMHATPRPASITNTTEIFRYDKNKSKWIY